MKTNKFFRRSILCTFCHSMLLLIFFASDLMAEDLSLHPLFTNHMVLQREAKVAIFGHANPGEQVFVSFAGQNKSVETSQCGDWKVMLDDMPASFTPQTLEVKSSTGNQQLSINDILVGDVWLCGGQSNMDHPISSYPLLKETVKEVKESSIRLLDIAVVASDAEQDNPVFNGTFKKGWHECSGNSLQQFSPVGYFFGKKLNRELNVPIGLLESSRGATRVEPWIPQENLAALGESVETILDKKGKTSWQSPSALYNGMIHPLTDFTFKGVIWYQGESNSRWPIKYVTLFPEMIKSWREKFGVELPFYFVQLASYKTGNNIKNESTWAWLREAQTKTLELPNTAMAVAIDLGEYNDIHPQNKQPVGERLALAALKYAGKKVIVSGPKFKKMKIKKNKCLIEFENKGSSLITKRVAMNKNKNIPFGEDPEAFIAKADKLEGFVICGSDRKFVKAEAKIEGKKVIVWSPEVSDPIAVRYGWASFALCNLYNKEGLPAIPFRTDSFPAPDFLGETNN